MLNEKFPKVKAVLVRVSRGDIHEIDIDISTKTNEVTKYLGGPATFIGQWPEHEIVLLKCADVRTIDPPLNENILRHPFEDEEVLGSILCIRMDKDALPRDLTLKEFLEHKLVLS